VGGVYYLELGDFCLIAAEVLLARNHPLPDGNKRCAFLSVERFLAVNGWPIQGANPDVDTPMVERIAAGEASFNEIRSWLDHRTKAET
jgi:death on curing protein